jgi:hypothetical protein
MAAPMNSLLSLNKLIESMHVENIAANLLMKSFNQSLQFFCAGSQTWPLFVFQFIFKHPTAEPQ